MKHAYLIIVHNELVVLQELVTVLDDPRNDIYIHYDKKIQKIPVINTFYSSLYVLPKRINGIWGDVSLIEIELALFNCAFNCGEYAHYHLISGTHFPLKSQNYIHDFFDKYRGQSLIVPMDTNYEEIKMKLGKYHFFLRYLVHHNQFVNQTDHLLWRICLKMQPNWMGRNISQIKRKSSQWCSLSNEAVFYLLSIQDKILKQYSKTFCCDEFFVWNSLENGDIPIIEESRLLYVSFEHSAPKVLTRQDYEKLVQSEYLFARKFNGENIDLIMKIKETYLLM